MLSLSSTIRPGEELSQAANSLAQLLVPHDGPKKKQSLGERCFVVIVSYITAFLACGTDYCRFQDLHSNRSASLWFLLSQMTMRAEEAAGQEANVQ